ncbi:MAG: YsnF/AvaK domain-containing protein [Chloroflexota bacterium]|nr:YsnF/AvaK domain-containing protein [Chloroflexota bacterium]
MAQNTSTVVGIFPDQSWAQSAIDALRSDGFNARLADRGTVSNLANLGIDSNAASLYSSRFGEGNVVVIVENAGNRGEDALGIMLQNGAENIDLSKDGTAGATTTTTTTTDYYQSLQNTAANERQYGYYDESLGRARNAEEMRVLLREETLTPVKQAVQAGEVQVQKVVHEREQEIPVNLRHEEVTIERRAVDRPATADDLDDMTDQVISVPVYEERAELQKQARVREEVTIGKQAVEEQQTLTGTTRHEHLEVNESGNVRVQGDADANTYDQR